MSNVSKHTHKPQMKPQNIGTIDRLLRAIIGFGLLSTVFIAAKTTGTFFGYSTENFPYYAVTLLSIYPALTAVLGWDPIYQVLRVRSETALKADVSGTVKEQAEAVIDSVSDKLHTQQ